MSSLRKVNQLIQVTIVEQYFTNIASLQNMGALYQIWLNEIYGVISLICQNTTMWVYGLKHIALYVQKHIAPRVVCYNFPLLLDTPLGARASLGLIYSVNMRQENGSGWVQIMACLLVDSKPLSEPVLEYYYYFDPKLRKKTLVKF